MSENGSESEWSGGEPPWVGRCRALWPGLWVGSAHLLCQVFFHQQGERGPKGEKGDQGVPGEPVSALCPAPHAPHLTQDAQGPAAAGLNRAVHPQEPG